MLRKKVYIWTITNPNAILEDLKYSLLIIVLFIVDCLLGYTRNRSDGCPEKNDNVLRIALTKDGGQMLKKLQRIEIRIKGH